MRNMIGNMLRNFIGWDDGEESKYGKAMHIKVSIDVEKPFKKVLLIRTLGESHHKSYSLTTVVGESNAL